MLFWTFYETININYPKNKLKFLIVGDGEERKELESYANSCTLSNVKFFGAIYDDDKVSELFKISDLFLLPGSVGLAIIHAFSFGLPIITEEDSFHGPEVENLINGENGYFVKKDNIDELAKVVFDFSINDQKLKLMSNNALTTASTTCSIENMVKQMDKCFKVF